MELRNSTVIYSKTQSYLSREYEKQLNEKLSVLQTELDKTNKDSVQADMTIAKE